VSDGSLIVVSDRNPAFCEGVVFSLRRRGARVVESAIESVVVSAARLSADLVIIGASPADHGAAIGAVTEIRSGTRARVILVVEGGSEAVAVAALRAGATDYLTKPCEAADVARTAMSCLKTPAAPSKSQSRPQTPAFIGDSTRMVATRTSLAEFAANNTNVLITGETGTGKELAATLVHGWSPRAHRRLVSINCAAIPEGLLESELFGYERGAFTGAAASRTGQLQLASGGTVFFDEVGDMGLLAQAKVLRAIECREVYPLGATRPIPIDVRIVAATNQDVEKRVEESAFRKDLYYRLNVARVHLPPLRERREDIPLLLAHYITEMNRRLGRQVDGLTDDAQDRLVQYDWPGNIRELRNVVEVAFLTLKGQRIGFPDIPEHVRNRLAAPAEVRDDERGRLASALSATNWNKSLAAERLHWSRMTVYRKIAKYRLVRSRLISIPNSTDDDHS
jgi:DNA-binding NtrC family response regulator